MTEVSAQPALALLGHDCQDPPVFLPGNLLNASRIQKNLPPVTVPAGCLLDFDGELVDYLVAGGRAKPEPGWPCFHTRLYRWTMQGREYGIIGGTVGAPFAVLVAEELFASGCHALVSIASAGLIAEKFTPPLFLLIDKALRDEGTSYHYLPPARYAESDRTLVDAVEHALEDAGLSFCKGSSWTTDAPFRETGSLIAARRAEGIVAVEMEAAALLAMGASLGRPVVCLAHITNAMASRSDDFDKGGNAGQETALHLCAASLAALLPARGRRKGEESP